MIDLEQATIESIVIHKIGVKATAEDDPKHNNFCSKHAIQFLDEQTQLVLKNFFAQTLKSPDLYHFRDTNPAVQTQVEKVFSDKMTFIDVSIQLAQQLYDTLDETNEIGSEFYMVHFSDCNVDDQTVEAVGIFASDAKDDFLKIMQNENEVNFQVERGINLKKLDKACIIFNIEPEFGYVVKAHDNSKIKEPYWIDKFLEIKVVENEYFNTESFFKLCKEFNDEVLAPNETVRNEERIQFLQKSLDYFQNNQSFNADEFNETAIGHPQVIEEFNNFKQRFRNHYEVEAPSTFDIDSNAVKKSKKYLRSVIKLDKNFHIYVHSRPEYLEKGYDQQKEKSFYKVFFEVES